MSSRHMAFYICSSDAELCGYISKVIGEGSGKSIVCSSDGKGLHDFPRQPGSRVIIFDTLCGGGELRLWIYDLICRHRSLLCVYLCERSDTELFKRHPRIMRVERPFSGGELIRTLMRATDLSMALTRLDNTTDLQRIEQAVGRMLRSLGIPAHLKGYTYLRIAIARVVKNPDMIRLITKRLYISIANEFATLQQCVERSMRHAIDCAWENGDPELLNQYFGSIVKHDHGRPTNSEFIATLAEIIRSELYFG